MPSTSGLLFLRFLSTTVLSLSVLLSFPGCHNSSTESPPVQKSRELFVAVSHLNNVAVFDAASAGSSLPIRTFGDLTRLYTANNVAVDSLNNEIYVTDGASITVYPRTAGGNVAPVRTISGSSTQIDQPEGMAIDAEHDELFVLNRGSGVIVVFRRTATGNVSPKRTIAAKVGDTYPLGSIALDVTNNELYVGMLDGSIAVHARDSVGSAAPLRVIAGSKTGLSRHNPQAISVDAVQDEVLVLAWNYESPPFAYTVFVYPRTATDNVPPLRSIGIPGSVSGFNDLRTMAVDAATNEIFIGNISSHTILVFPRTADGSTPPQRTIVGPETGLHRPIIALDVPHGEIVAVNTRQPLVSGSITTYPQAASGNAAPLRTISGTSSGITSLRAISLDMARDEVLVANLDSIAVFPAASNGDVVPSRRIFGEATALSDVRAIAVDSVNDELFVLQGISVLVFRRTSDGNIAPLRRLSGPSTGLYFPTSLAIDPVHGELLIADQGAIRAYPRNAAGDAAPLRSVTGPSTQLGYLTAIAVDAQNDEVTVSSISDYRHSRPDRDAVLTFPRAESGDRTPLRILNGSSVGLYYPGGLAVDPANEEVFVAGATQGGVNVYARKASGNTAPLRLIAGTGNGSIALGTR